jgi:plastocyanin
MKYGKSLIAALLGASALLSTSAMAADHVVKAVGTKFDPLVIQVAPGDTVSWENMNGHISNTDFNGTTYIPEGAQGWTSEMGENFKTQPLTKEGVYLYKCDPHWGNRMGGVVVVGNPTNLDALLATKPKGGVKYLLKKAQKAVK